MMKTMRFRSRLPLVQTEQLNYMYLIYCIYNLYLNNKDIGLQPLLKSINTGYITED